MISYSYFLADKCDGKSEKDCNAPYCTWSGKDSENICFKACDLYDSTNCEKDNHCQVFGSGDSAVCGLKCSYYEKDELCASDSHCEWFGSKGCSDKCSTKDSEECKKDTTYCQLFDYIEPAVCACKCANYEDEQSCSSKDDCYFSNACIAKVSPSFEIKEEYVQFTINDFTLDPAASNKCATDETDTTLIKCPLNAFSKDESKSTSTTVRGVAILIGSNEQLAVSLDIDNQECEQFTTEETCPTSLFDCKYDASKKCYSSFGFRSVISISMLALVLLINLLL